jgi:hypothetical protein
MIIFKISVKDQNRIKIGFKIKTNNIVQKLGKANKRKCMKNNIKI